MQTKYEILSREEIQIIEENWIDDMLGGDEHAQYVYSKWFYDIEYFTDYYLSHIKSDKWEYVESPEFHKEILDYYVNNTELDINLIIARQHAKTTITWFYMLWLVLYFPWKALLYIASKWLWEKTLWKIRRELEINELLIWVFWNLVPKNSDDPRDAKLLRWRQRELEMLNWSYLESLTSWQKARWTRFDNVFIDDPQEDIDVDTPKKAQKFIDWYDKTVEWLNKDLRTIVIWTIVWELCFVKFLRDKRKWFTVEYTWCDVNYWNILWTWFWNKELFKRKRDWYFYTDPRDWKRKFKKWMWKAKFNQEYRNIPTSKEDRMVKEYWIKYHTWIKEFDKIIMSIDPATWIKEKHDFTWIVVCWLIWNNVYELYSTWLKLSPNKLLKTVYNIFLQWKPDVVIKEANKEAKLAEDLLLKGVPLLDIWTSKDKFVRLDWIATLVESWFCYFLERDDLTEVDENKDLISQLTNFPEVEHDDVMDAWMMCMENIQTEFEWDGTDDDVFII